MKLSNMYFLVAATYFTIFVGAVLTAPTGMEDSSSLWILYIVLGVSGVVFTIQGLRISGPGDHREIAKKRSTILFMWAAILVTAALTSFVFLSFEKTYWHLFFSILFSAAGLSVFVEGILKRSEERSRFNGIEVNMH